MMKTIAACAIVAALHAAAASAADTATEPKPGSQQSRFATCAHESRGLRGEEHQKFMSDCLRGERDDGTHETRQASASEPGTHPNRMRSCNDEAGKKNLHGDERRAFMSACLKG